jgi:hypothetical protein
MGLKFRATSMKAALKPGLYQATLDEIERRNGANGEFLLWKFIVDHGEQEVTVSAATSTRFSPQAKARQYAEALRGRPLRPDEDIDLEDLYGNGCQLVVTVEELDEHSTVNRIEKVLPLPRDEDSDDVPF